MLKQCIGICFFFCVSVSAYAEAGFGICDFGKVTLPSIICNGPGFLKETTVKGDIKITGSVEAHNITASSIIVNGSVTIYDSKVGGVMEVVGNLNSTNVAYKQGLVITGEHVLLNHSTVAGEVNIESSTKKPQLKMICGSIVAGSVTFVGLEGVVQVTGDSRVQGKIMNGTIEFIDDKCSSS